MYQERPDDPDWENDETCPTCVWILASSGPTAMSVMSVTVPTFSTEATRIPAHCDKYRGVLGLIGQIASRKVT